MDNIDSIVDKALGKPRKMLEEPKHVLVHRWFKTWKMFSIEDYNLSGQSHHYKLYFLFKFHPENAV